MNRKVCYTFLALVAMTRLTLAQDFNTVRDDQINRLKNYIVAAIQPSGLVRDSIVLNGSSFHPATPDAAGFALIGLSALDHLNKLPGAEQRVKNILNAYAGNSAVTPDRSADGHFVHFMNIGTGIKQGGGWDESYTPIGTALLVAGAQFAKNHFADDPDIALLVDQLTRSVNFNAAISPALDGGIFHNMTKAGGGAGGTAHPWNEYMLVESLALRETNNARALAVKDLWLNTNNIPKANWQGTPTLTDNPGSFAPSFWVQQMHFFNADFRTSASFETFFQNQRIADKGYSSQILGESFRYGNTAGVSPGPNGDEYEVNSIFNNPDRVFSPEAVAAWGDMTTLLQFYNQQIPTSNPRYQYGMVRVSAGVPSFIPGDAALVDHLFLLYGLIESLDPDFFKDRVFGYKPGDYNRDGVVSMADYTDWQSTYGSTTIRGADGNLNGIIDTGDYVLWRKAMSAAGGGGTGVPEPAAVVSVLVGIGAIVLQRTRRNRVGA